ncbi:Carbonic anhydrase 14, partial [Lamellibrachia satsuma]
MGRLSVVVALLLALHLLDGALANEGVHWSYSGDGAPEHWANLEGKYKSCGKDKQSPIDIDTDDVVYREELNEFDMTGYDQTQGVLLLKNNGHTAQVDTLHANWTLTGGSLTDTYRHLQFHFHWGTDKNTGSEHTLNSKRYPLEMHMVHMSTKYNDDLSVAIEKDKSLAVFAVMFEVGTEDNAAFKKLTDGLNNVKHKGENVTLPLFSLRSLMPTNLSDYFNYDGSLTTPPCSEVVVWNIFHETVKLSESQ